MNPADAAPQEAVGRWFVGFLGHEDQFLIDRISPRGFRHCLCFGYHAASERWLVYNVRERRTDVFAATPEQLILWLAGHKEQGMRVLSVDMPEHDDTPNLWARFGLYCVSATKHLLGSRSRALRPIALWRDLLAAGAVEAFTGNDDGARSEEEA